MCKILDSKFKYEQLLKNILFFKKFYISRNIVILKVFKNNGRS